MVKNIYVDMCADLFHFGHVSLLKRAKNLGDNLIVGIHSDKTIESYKRKPIMNMKERISVLEACKYIDKIIPNAPLEIKEEFIKSNNIHLVAHAHDETENEKYNFMYKVPSDMGIFIRLDYTPSVSTTHIINRIKNI